MGGVMARPTVTRARREPSRLQLEQIQRSRLMAAAVAAIDELGYEQATVGQITRRARVSRRTFYELFANREQCFVAVLDDLVEHVSGDLAAAGVDGLAWRERMRVGLLAILSFLDREPVIAQVCVVGALGGGPLMRARRDAVIVQLTAAVDEGRGVSGHAEHCTQLTAEGVVGAALAIVYARLVREEREPLTSLLGELMAMITLPYMGAATARRERVQSARYAVAAPSGEREPAPAGNPLLGVQMRLTYRTARVLEGLRERPGASNREVADDAGIGDPGQVSKLLHRLERLGLLENRGGGHGQGEPNKWVLTVKGESVAQSVRLRGPYERRAA